MSAHTPGPWKVSESGHIVARDARRTIIADIGNLHNESIAADASLIAAAPDMLAALKAIRANRDSRDDDHEVALGEPCMDCSQRYGVIVGQTQDEPHLCEDCLITRAIAKAEGAQ